MHKCYWHVHWITWRRVLIQMNQQLNHQINERRNRERTTCSHWVNLLQSCSLSSGQKIALLHYVSQYTINPACGPCLSRLYCKCKCVCASMYACVYSMHWCIRKTGLWAHMFLCRSCVFHLCMHAYVIVHTMSYVQYMCYVFSACIIKSLWVLIRIFSYGHD